MKIVATNNRSFLDIIAVTAGGIHTLFESALISGVSVHEVPEPDTKLEIVLIAKRLTLPMQLPVLKPQKRVVATHLQNVQDLTLQTTGSLEHIFEMAMLNGISISQTPTVGMKYRADVADTNVDIVNYYQAKGIKPATGIKVNQSTDCVYAVCDYVENDYWI